MTNSLPAPAELYLRNLEKALWPLGSDEREAILLELRDHLAGCAAQGPERLHEALRDLGTPEECARAFQVEGAGDARTGIAPALPPEFARPPERLSAREIVGQVRATFRASRAEFWAIGALLVTVLTSTNFLYYMHALRPGIVAETWSISAVRLVVILMAMIAAYRAILTSDQRVWSLNAASFRFAGAMVLLAAVAVGAILLARSGLELLLPPSSKLAPVVRPLFLLALLLAVSAACLRLQPWLAALATDRRDVTLRRVIAGTRGKVGAILKGWAVLVLPLALLHFAVTALVFNTAPLRPFHLGLAGLDGVISACLAIAAALLNATLFRWVTGEPIPAPRAFNPELPSEKFVEEARARLRMHIDAGGRVAR